MKIIEPSFEILFPTAGLAEAYSLRLIETAGRTCYKSEDKITDESAPAFAGMLIDRTHTPMIEFGIDPIVRWVCDRGVSHELVRHRLASYAQESTRYCNYGKAGVTFIRPCFWSEQDGQDGHYDAWRMAMSNAESTYLAMLDNGASPQQARSVLPSSLKTEVVIKMNHVSWRHFFYRRTAKAAHPQMRQLARPMLAAFRKLIPVVFDDVGMPG